MSGDGAEECREIPRDLKRRTDTSKQRKHHPRPASPIKGEELIERLP